MNAIHKALQWEAAWESQGAEEMAGALELSKRTKEDFGHLPWPSLNNIVKGIPRGKLWYVVIASNNGKTTFVRNLANAITSNYQPLFIMSTETSPEVFRLGLAALEAGIDPGDFETGEVLDMENSVEIQSQIGSHLDLNSLRSLEKHKRLQFPWQKGFLTSEGILGAAERAAEQGAEWFIVDHIDHVNPVGPGGEIAQSNAVNAALYEATVQFGLRTIAMSQMNQTPFKLLKRMALLSVPVEDWVKYGGTKKQFADGMLGGWRPLRSPAPDKDQIAAYQAGDLPLTDIAMPGAMRFITMKHRAKGALIGHKATLEVHKGLLREPSYYERGGLVHGISTSAKSTLDRY